MKFYSHKYILENEVTVNPMGEIAGFQVRPGMFDIMAQLPWQMVCVLLCIPIMGHPANCCCSTGRKKSLMQ